MKFQSTKIIDLGSCAFRQWRADSHCKHIHGYRLSAKFWFGCVGLDDKSWVVDFGGLKTLRELLEKQFDHTLCIAADDPLLNMFKELHNAGGCDLRIMESGVGIENFAKFCFITADEYIRKTTVGRCWVEKVEVWEHEKNSAMCSYNLADIQPSHIDPSVATDVSVNSIESAETVSTNSIIHEQKEETTGLKPVPLSNPKNIQQQEKEPSPLKPVPLSNAKSSGWGNPFQGTSWGV